MRGGVGGGVGGVCMFWYRRSGRRCPLSLLLSVGAKATDHLHAVFYAWD